MVAMGTRNLIVMFTDIQGFTARVSQGSREELVRLRDVHEKLLVPVFRHFRGRIVKRVGDAFLVVFESPTDAVLCGVAIQEVLRQYNAGQAEEDRLGIRVAINAGEVETSEGDVLGEPVNLAARLEAIAEAGEVYFTEAVYLTMNRSEAPSTEVGERTFKGIPYPVRVFKVSHEKDSALARRFEHAIRLTEDGPVIEGLVLRRPWFQRPVPLVVGIAAVVVLVILGFLLSSNGRSNALRDARAAIAAGEPERALSALDDSLREHTDDQELIDLAREAARAQLETLAASSPAEALTWLRAQLERRPWLEPLRSRVPALDARVTLADLMPRLDGVEPWQELQPLLQRWPKDPEVPLIAARTLQGKVYHYAPMRLYEEAIARGWTPDEALRDECLRMYTVYSPGGHLDQSAAFLSKYFRADWLAWAQRTFASTTKGIELVNAFDVLEELEDPIAKRAEARILAKSMNGFKDEAAADEALATFLKIDDPQERQRILALHRWVLDRDKGVSWGGQHFDLVQRNLQRLEEAWS